MNALTFRTCLLAFVLLLCHLGVTWVESGYSFTVRVPDRSLEGLAYELEGMSGRDEPLPAEIVTFVNASSHLSRIYKSKDGRPVALYAAAWADESIASDVTPHHPEVCYPNAGWRIVARQEVQLETSSGVLPLGLTQLEREGQRLVVAHWFQLGPHRYTNRTAGRQAYSQLWGQKQWPPLVKVMLQTPAPTMDQAAPLLEHIARSVHHWTSAIQ